jgi:hypothetical protein
MKALKISILFIALFCFKQVKSQTDTLTVYPNPFTDTLNIQIYLVSNDTVTITVYNILGQVIKTLAYDSVMAAGNHSIVYNASSLATGVYFVSIKINGYTTTKKIIKPSTTNSIETITTNINSIIIFPNPNNGNITLQGNSELGLITIYNDIGELIYQQIIKENKTQIDLSQDAKGTYFLKGNANVDVSILNSGVYNINISSSNGVVNKRLVIVK